MFILHSGFYFIFLGAFINFVASVQFAMVMNDLLSKGRIFVRFRKYIESIDKSPC